MQTDEVKFIKECFSRVQEYRWEPTSNPYYNQLLVWINYWDLPFFMQQGQQFLDGVFFPKADLQDDGVCFDLLELVGDEYEEDMKIIFPMEVEENK
ncbi:hypothetical protein IWT25_02316 [Secundilactobacillus pentosiphilus]|uniref:Uncharacterized protein n=1 Tax=Secundilactobacillus pentosiphilus TaxID=1714682 RepID=A0A1Z5IZK4_9LACO|nr:hypothetical protein [Secundilactobacillus pentosiphilus]GAX06968.1 hypothetical protein IWT25_02316 [Secundilactobacillus pentosiphilus]